MKSKPPTPKSLAKQSEANERIYTFLHSHPIGVLVTVHPEGDPSGSVVYYSIREDFTVLFATKRDTRKHANIQHDSRAMLVVYEQVSQTTAQVRGIAKEIRQLALAREAYAGMLEASLQTSEAGIPPLAKLELGDYVAYKLVPTEASMAIFERPDPGAFQIYERIDFKHRV